jgi:spermidine synthase
VILLAAAGALSMLAQVVVLRELVAALYGVELLYVLALGAWLVGTGLGAAAGRLFPATLASGPAGCAALGLLVPVELVVIRVAAPLAGAVTGAYLPFPAQLLWIAAATIPPAALCGWLFPALAGAASARRSLSVGRSYAVESAGAAAGGAGLTVAIALGASTFQVAAVAPVIGAVAVFAARRRWPVHRRFWLSVSVLTVCGTVAVFGRAWDLSLLRRIYPSLVEAADTPYGRVILSGPASQVAVYENGALVFDTEGFSAEAFADLAGLQHGRPARALVIGGGGEGVPDALARHRIPEIDNVEVDRRAYDLVRARSAGATSRAKAGSAVRVHFEEPRLFLERPVSYDLILVAAGEPVSGASSRFYTREFFALCARRLTPDGVLALRLAAAENVWPRPLVRRTASIVTAVREVFTAVEILPGATLYVLASNGGPAATPAVLAARLQERGIQPRLITPPYLQYLYTNDRRRELEALLESAAGERPNTDSAPVCYRYAALLWLSSFYPSLAAASVPLATRLVWLWWGGAAAVALAAVAWLRRGRNRRAAAGLFGAGFVGMVLETVLLLRFQIANGVVYQQVGWLLTCFMAGMAAGGWAGGGGVPLRPGRWGRLAIPAALSGASIATVLTVMWMPASAGLAGTSVLLAAAGAAVGIAFAAGAGIWRGEPGAAASALYAADVVGGALGALAATLVLVPVAGLAGAAAAALAAGTALFALIPRSGSGDRG